MSQIYALPDGRHIAVGTLAGLGDLDCADADMDQLDHAVLLERGVLDAHHLQTEADLGRALARADAAEARAAELEARLADLQTEWGVRYVEYGVEEISGGYWSREGAESMIGEVAGHQHADGVLVQRQVGSWKDAESPASDLQGPEAIFDAAVRRRVQRALAAAGVSAEQIAEQCENPERFLGAVAGRHRITTLYLALIAEATGAATSDLLRGAAGDPAAAEIPARRPGPVPPLPSARESS